MFYQPAADDDRDGIPNVMIEAMATGLPVVSTWFSGIPELVIDGEPGPGLRARLGRKARQKVECEFTIAAPAAMLGELFATVPVREARA